MRQDKSSGTQVQCPTEDFTRVCARLVDRSLALQFIPDQAVLLVQK